MINLCAQHTETLLLQETAINAVANAIVITDRAGAIQWANPAFTRSTGYTRDEVLGKNPRILKSGQQSADFYQHLWQTILSGQVWQGVFINKCKDGSVVHEEATITPVRDEQGDVSHFVAVKQDVTQRVLAEQALQEAKRKAEAANQAKSNFLAIMSHEIRSPLNVVLGVLELLKESDVEQGYQEQIRLALGSGNMLMYLINDLLDHSKIEANQLVLDSIQFNVHTLLDEIIQGMAPLAHAKNIELTGFFYYSGTVTVVGDPNRLRQIFTNLIGNAIKFTPAGGIVECHGGPVSRAAGHIEFLFEVRDTGIGIPVTERERIFERFVQANTATTRQYGGTGLGLSICRSIVQLMGGTIGIDDNMFAASGSIFHFTVRLLESLHLFSDPQTGMPNGMRVLIVGSHGVQLAMLRTVLQGWKMRCEAIQSLQTAFAEMRSAATRGEPYALVIVNQWPGQNRPPELNELRDIDPHSRFLLLTDQLDQGLDQAVELPGDTLCLKKPFNADQLASILNALLCSDQGRSPTPDPLSTEPSPAVHRSAAVLVVDDQAANLTVALGMLVKLGCDRRRCVTVTTAQQAVERFQQESFDIVLMDCQMPVMDGYQATRLLRAWEQQQGHTPLPIIAFSADLTQMNRQRAEEAGMSDFLAKPLSIDRLRGILDKYLPLQGTASAPLIESTALHGAEEMPNDPFVIRALQTLGLGDEDMPTVAQLIIDQLPQLLHTLERDLHNKQYEQVRATSHVLRGSILNTVFPEMKRQTNLLHRAVCNQAWREVSQQLERVRMAFSPIQEALTIWLAQANPATLPARGSLPALARCDKGELACISIK
ncbi:MAG: ATP-binding protein [Magnetococcus sp. YQC-3]